MKKETNWSVLLDDSTLGREVMAEFAEGKESMTSVSRTLSHTHMAGEFRKLVRRSGTTKARSLARKALQRRGIR